MGFLTCFSYSRLSFDISPPVLSCNTVRPSRVDQWKSITTLPRKSANETGKPSTLVCENSGAGFLKDKFGTKQVKFHAFRPVAHLTKYLSFVFVHFV